MVQGAAFSRNFIQLRRLLRNSVQNSLQRLPVLRVAFYAATHGCPHDRLAHCRTYRGPDGCADHRTHTRADHRTHTRPDAGAVSLPQRIRHEWRRLSQARQSQVQRLQLQLPPG